jgi:hypothetical protein
LSAFNPVPLFKVDHNFSHGVTLRNYDLNTKSRNLSRISLPMPTRGINALVNSLPPAEFSLVFLSRRIQRRGDITETGRITVAVIESSVHFVPGRKNDRSRFPPFQSRFQGELASNSRAFLRRERDIFSFRQLGSSAVIDST